MFVKLDLLLDAVHDRESFFTFVRALMEDRVLAVAKEEAAPCSPYGPDAGGWENTTIESYLEATLAYAEDWARKDPSGSTQGLPCDPTWSGFARILDAGKFYE